MTTRRKSLAELYGIEKAPNVPTGRAKPGNVAKFVNVGARGRVSKQRQANLPTIINNPLYGNGEGVESHPVPPPPSLKGAGQVARATVRGRAAALAAARGAGVNLPKPQISNNNLKAKLKANVRAATGAAAALKAQGERKNVASWERAMRAARGKRVGAPIAEEPEEEESAVAAQAMTKNILGRIVKQGVEANKAKAKANAAAAAERAALRAAEAASTPQGAEAFMNTIRRLARTNNTSFNLAQARAALNAYNRTRRGRPRFMNNKNVKALRQKVGWLDYLPQVRAPPPRQLNVTPPATKASFNSGALTKLLTAAILKAVTKPKPGSAPSRAPFNSRALTALLTAAIKKAIAKPKPEAGTKFNSGALTKLLTAAIAKAVGSARTAVKTNQPKAPEAKTPAFNSKILTKTLMASITKAIAGIKPPSPSRTNQPPPKAGNQPPSPSRTNQPPPSVNSSKIAKAISEALAKSLKNIKAAKPPAPEPPRVNKETPGPPDEIWGLAGFNKHPTNGPYLRITEAGMHSALLKRNAVLLNITNMRNRVKYDNKQQFTRIVITRPNWNKWVNSQKTEKTANLNKNALMKSLSNSLARAFARLPGAASTRQTAQPGVPRKNETPRAPGKNGAPGAPGAPGKTGAPGPPGKNGARQTVRPVGAAPVSTSITGPTVTGPTITGPTITVAAPNIKIQLNGLARATEQARQDPNKLANLERMVANLKSKLPNGSEAKKAVVELFPSKGAPLPTPNNVEKKVNKAMNKEQVAIQKFKQVAPPAGKKLRNMSFGELLSMRRSAKNKAEINRYLRQDIDSEMRKIERMSSSDRGWRLGELYKSLPDSFPGKARVARAIQSEIRRAGRERDPIEGERRLKDLYGNLGLGRRLPRELSREFKIQNQRLKTNYRREENRYARRYGGGSLREGRAMYQSMHPMRQSALMQRGPSYSTGTMAQQTALRQGGSMKLPSLSGPKIFAGPKALTEGTSLALPSRGREPVLPPNQQSAISRIGGPTQALKVVAGVPGGAPAVARAAADLNEMNGNVKKAQELKGTPISAIRAVKKLGGAKSASYALEGLNTLAQTRKTQVRKAVKGTTRRAKPAPVRLNELNKVIEAVKRKKLVSLVTHNVGNVNNNKKKKYYKKVIKSYILKKPLANKVRQAAKK